MMSENRAMQIKRNLVKNAMRKPDVPPEPKVKPPKQPLPGVAHRIELLHTDTARFLVRLAAHELRDLLGKMRDAGLHQDIKKMSVWLPDNKGETLADCKERLVQLYEEIVRCRKELDASISNDIVEMAKDLGICAPELAIDDCNSWYFALEEDETEDEYMALK